VVDAGCDEQPTAITSKHMRVITRRGYYSFMPLPPLGGTQIVRWTVTAVADAATRFRKITGSPR